MPNASLVLRQNLVVTLVLSGPTGDVALTNSDVLPVLYFNFLRGPAGQSGGGANVDDETPAGLVNGVNTVFALSIAPAPARSLQLFRNGVLQSLGVDYALVGLTVTFTLPPQIGDALVCWYRH